MNYGFEIFGKNLFYFEVGMNSKNDAVPKLEGIAKIFCSDNKHLNGVLYQVDKDLTALSKYNISCRKNKFELKKI